MGHTPIHLQYEISDPNNVFMVSDFHFDHTNIIKYCNRPFKTVQEMNQVMFDNYCEVVKEDSLVFFLGDMAFGKGSNPPKYWLSLLPGKIVYIKGSHDKGIHTVSKGLNAIKICNDRLIEIKNLFLYLMHDPRTIRATDDTWIIHGHTHNNTPFFDPVRHRINVSVDVTDFKPTRFSEIIDMIERKEK